MEFRIEKCPIPIVWLDTSVLVGLAKRRLGILNDKIQENRLNRLHEYVYKLTRDGKLLCPEAGQPSEIWAKRSDFFGIVHELSLGMTARPKGAIEETQIHRLMTSYVSGTCSTTFSYTDAFIDDPLPRLAETLARGHFVTVDSTLAGTVEQLKSQRDVVSAEWEELRKRCIEQGITFDQQLERERVGGIQATIAMARDCLAKVENGKEPSENERWSLASIVSLVHAWDRLGGAPKGHRGLLAFLDSPYYGITPCVSISSTLVAKLVTERGRKIQHGDAMDVDHICSVLPYADLMIVDSAMKSVVQGLGLDEKYRTTVCYIGDDKEIAAFFAGVEKSALSVSPFSRSSLMESPRRRP